MKKEYDFSQLKPANKKVKNLDNAKVVRTLRIDARVLTWLAKEAELKGIPYQTLINSILTEAMKTPEKERLRKIIREVVKEELRKAS